MARQVKTAQEIYSSGLSMKELRRQYSWRSYEARKKIERLRQKYGEDSSIVQEMEDKFRPLRELGDLSRKQLSQQLSRTYDFGGSKTGQTYENVADKLKSAGFEHVNEDNIKATLDFLDDARARGISAIYGSEGIIEVANRATRQGLTMEEWRRNVDYWMDQSAKRGKKGPIKPRLQKRFLNGGSSAYRKRK